ncbi:MAG: YfhO family protein [Desulfobacterales bacterium]|nr:YfhO family protein [Desulfobacterales bacterium]
MELRLIWLKKKTSAMEYYSVRDPLADWRWALPVLAVLAMVFFSRFLFTGRFFLLRDLVFDFYPRQAFFKEHLLRATLPLWNPYTGSGEPFLTNMESGVLYPLNLIHLLLPVTYATTISVTMHLFLAGAGMWLACRLWQVTGKGALLAAIGFVFGTFAITRIEFYSFLCSFSWYPLAVGLFTLWLQKRRLWMVLALSTVLGLQILAGYPDAVLFTGGTLGLYALIAGFSFGRKQRRAWAFISPLLALGLAVSAAAALSLAQTLPVLEFLPHSLRSSQDPLAAMASVNPAMLLTALFPFAYGTQGYYGKYWAPSSFEFWVGNYYVGILPLIILFTVLVRRTAGKRDGPGKTSGDLTAGLRTPFLLTVLVFFLLYAMGRHTPFFSGLWHLLPPIRMFRWPAKALMAVVFALCCLAGIGLDWLGGERSGPGQNLSPWRLFLVNWGPFIVFMALAVLALACLWDDGRLGKWLLVKVFNLGAVKDIYVHRIPWKLLARESVKFSLVTAACALILQAYAARGAWKHAAAVLMPLVLFADLAVTTYPLLPSSDMDILQNRSRYLKALVDGRGPGRFFRPVRDVQQRLYGETDEDLLRLERESMAASWPMVDRAYGIQPMGDFPLAHFTSLLNLLGHSQLSVERKHFILRMINCSAIVMAGYNMDYFAGKGRGLPTIHPVEQALPRVFVVQRVKTYAGFTDLLAAVALETFDPMQVVLSDDPAIKETGFTAQSPRNSAYSITRVRDGFNQLAVEVESEKKGLLVINDTYAPGWKARVNGELSAIHRVNGAFRAVVIPAGKSLVQMRYRPPSLNLGILVSLAALAAVCLLSVWDIRRNGI